MDRISTTDFCGLGGTQGVLELNPDAAHGSGSQDTVAAWGLGVEKIPAAFEAPRQRWPGTKSSQVCPKAKRSRLQPR